jgi:pimeloyl-ACP methyl ester carboxylesterase
MSSWAKGVVTFATQSAGCEEAGAMSAPLLAFHGTHDEILPLFSSQAVCSLVGGPHELVVCEGDGHLLSAAGDVLRDRVPGWIRERFADEGAPTG